MMDEAAGERKRRGRRAILALSISSIVSLAGAELFCRRTYGVPLRERLPIVAVRANPRRGYEMIPGREHYTYEHLVRVNALGLRGPEVPAEKGDEVRVLCLGDSTTYGQGVAEEETIPALLERELAGRRPVRVINGGLRGYGTEQELALLEELGARIRPDVVVLVWYPNDLEKPDVEEVFERLEGQGAVAFDTEDHLVGPQRRAWRVRQLLRRSALLMQVHDVWSSLTATRLTPEQIDGGFARLDASFERFGEVAQALGSEIAVAAIPTAGMVAAGEGGRELCARVGEFAARHGFLFADLSEPLGELYRARRAPPLLPYDWHYTGEANAAMARRLATALRKRYAGSF